jgi:hypothetical protein
VVLLPVLVVLPVLRLAPHVCDSAGEGAVVRWWLVPPRTKLWLCRAAVADLLLLTVPDGPDQRQNWTSSRVQAFKELLLLSENLLKNELVLVQVLVLVLVPVPVPVLVHLFLHTGCTTSTGSTTVTIPVLVLVPWYVLAVLPVAFWVVQVVPLLVLTHSFSVFPTLSSLSRLAASPSPPRPSRPRP